METALVRIFLGSTRSSVWPSLAQEKCAVHSAKAKQGCLDALLTFLKFINLDTKRTILF
jgi:hypothetical protein